MVSMVSMVSEVVSRWTFLRRMFAMMIHIMAMYNIMNFDQLVLAFHRHLKFMLHTHTYQGDGHGDGELVVHGLHCVNAHARPKREIVHLYGISRECIYGL